MRAADYALNPNAGSFISIPAGRTQVDIAIVPLDDWLTEGPETLRIELEAETSAGTPVPYTIGGDDRVDLTILDNENPLLAPRVIVGVSALDAVGTETVAGTDPASFRISRSNNLSVAIEVPYTIGGTATPNSDFTPPPTAVTIPAGVAFMDVPIAPINDPLVEIPETVTLTLRHNLFGLFHHAECLRRHASARRTGHGQQRCDRLLHARLGDDDLYLIK